MRKEFLSMKIGEIRYYEKNDKMRRKLDNAKHALYCHGYDFVVHSERYLNYIIVKRLS